MGFSWLAFAQRHRISYVESGAHTHKGNLYVRCPFCRESDSEKRRMGLHLQSPRWGCWKDRRHSGADPVRLIRALIGCSWEQAVKEAQEEDGVRTPISTLRERLARLGSREGKALPEQKLPPHLKRFAGATTPPLSWYRSYLQRRGFPGKHADHLAVRYELLAGVEGKWDRRILIPFHTLDGVLIAWTGRSISKTCDLRYDTFGPTGQVLYNGHRLVQEGGRILVITEGPFDALKVDYYGADLGLRAVAVTGLGGVGKIGLVTQVFERGNFQHVMPLLDAAAMRANLDLMRSMRHLPRLPGRIPEGVKDPGDLTRRQVWALAGE